MTRCALAEVTGTRALGTDEGHDVLENLLDELEALASALVLLDATRENTDEGATNNLLHMLHRKARAATYVYGNREHLSDAERERWLAGDTAKAAE